MVKDVYVVPWRCNLLDSFILRMLNCACAMASSSGTVQQTHLGYIKFLVPPQESCCEQLRHFLTDYDTEEILPRDTSLRFANDVIDLEANKDELTPIASVTSTKTLSPTKTCRFAEVDDVVPSYEETITFDEGKDEVDAIHIPEPFKFPERASPFTFESASLSRPQIRAFSVPFPRITFDTTEVHDRNEPQSDVIFLPDSKESPLFPKAHAKVYTPTTPILMEKAPSIPHIRPKYTTQVSTLSTRSNTISLYSCWPPPIGIILISILEVLLFILNEKKLTNTGRHSHGNIADALIFDPSRRQEAWRFITYLFVHIGYQHLLFNLAVQIFLGVILEMVHERWRVLTIYFAGILAGSLGTSVFNPRVKLAGASGGVYALITAHIVTVILVSNLLTYF
ncbi:rhomboid-related protein [Holotrichia oblita]|nr:rhomboid-related protein [Holotrichia oblita]